MFDLKKIGEILAKDIKGGERELAKYDKEISEQQKVIKEHQQTIAESRQEIDAALLKLRELSQDKLQIEGVIMAYRQMSEQEGESK